MPSIDLIVTDLDGTLWHTDDHVDPKVVAALEELERRGMPLLVATGRRTASTRAPLARIGQSPRRSC
jgi:hydroxymethylpyrimidine pyrophosphatase-like HAD family hydrolase